LHKKQHTTEIVWATNFDMDSLSGSCILLYVWSDTSRTVVPLLHGYRFDTLLNIVKLIYLILHAKRCKRCILGFTRSCSSHTACKPLRLRLVPISMYGILAYSRGPVAHQHMAAPRSVRILLVVSLRVSRRATSRATRMLPNSNRLRKFPEVNCACPALSTVAPHASAQRLMAFCGPMQRPKKPMVQVI
jgi:hypothetical protein